MTCAHPSPVVHGLPSSQPLPSSSAVPAHVPELQVSFAVQGSASLQAAPSSGVASPAQVPSVHVSFAVQALPSSQIVPFATGVFEQTLAVHSSVVHGLESLQSAADPHGDG